MRSGPSRPVSNVASTLRSPVGVVFVSYLMSVVGGAFFPSGTKGERQDVSPPIPGRGGIVTAWNRATDVAPLAGTKFDRLSMVGERFLFSWLLIEYSWRLVDLLRR